VLVVNNIVPVTVCLPRNSVFCLLLAMAVRCRAHEKEVKVSAAAFQPAQTKTAPEGAPFLHSSWKPD
jgi:hypothetical protein